MKNSTPQITILIDNSGWPIDKIVMPPRPTNDASIDVKMEYLRAKWDRDERIKAAVATRVPGHLLRALRGGK